jgi:hypothetical protein
MAVFLQAYHLLSVILCNEVTIKRCGIVSEAVERETEYIRAQKGKIGH